MKEARTTTDKMVDDSNSGARRNGAVMGEVQATANKKDRPCGGGFVVALCPTGDEQNK